MYMPCGQHSMAPGGSNALDTCPKYQPMSILWHLSIPVTCINLPGASCYSRYFLKCLACSYGQPGG